jgi:hypothetical protein
MPKNQQKDKKFSNMPCRKSTISGAHNGWKKIQIKFDANQNEKNLMLSP